MQCLNPIIAYKKGFHANEFGEKVETLTGFVNFKKFCEGRSKDDAIKLLQRDDIYLLPCRKCVNCNLNRSREWAIRNSLEAKNYTDDCKIFLTLTYSDDFIPTIKLYNRDNHKSLDLPVLFYADVQSFLKRLRKRFEKYKIRFFCCGEYGGKTKRPHYHMLLYGLPLSAIDDLDLLYCSNRNNYYNSEIIAGLWQKGFVNITTFSDYTSMYVSRYCTKKNSPIYCFANSYKNEFISMSRRPGIGYKYFIDNKDNIYKNDKFLFHIDSKTFELKPLSYFDRQYDYENPKMMSFIKENRKKFFKQYEYFNTLETDLSIREYLENQERINKNKLKERSN